MKKLVFTTEELFCIKKQVLDSEQPLCRIELEHCSCSPVCHNCERIKYFTQSAALLRRLKKNTFLQNSISLCSLIDNSRLLSDAIKFVCLQLHITEI